MEVASLPLTYVWIPLRKLSLCTQGFGFVALPALCLPPLDLEAHLKRHCCSGDRRPSQGKSRVQHMRTVLLISYPCPCVSTPDHGSDFQSLRFPPWPSSFHITLPQSSLTFLLVLITPGLPSPPSFSPLFTNR